uniref:Uncharacterized protein n=1 Tax=Glossina pallidipes TaxID=7398 RepID=A0A1A9Z539_GLOPL
MTPSDYQAIQCFGKVVIGGGDTDGDTMKNYATFIITCQNAFRFLNLNPPFYALKRKIKFFQANGESTCNYDIDAFKLYFYAIIRYKFAYNRLKVEFYSTYPTPNKTSGAFSSADVPPLSFMPLQISTAAHHLHILD